MIQIQFVATYTFLTAHALLKNWKVKIILHKLITTIYDRIRTPEEIYNKIMTDQNLDKNISMINIA